VTESGIDIPTALLSHAGQTHSKEIIFMENRKFAWSNSKRLCRLAVLACLSTLPLSPLGASEKLPVIPKWSRFEQTFKSAITYSNALQDVTLTVRFTSPLGETTEVEGFWDGGRTWRVRFAPDLPGRWTLTTTCSDAANQGLHRQHGAFLCSAPIGENCFHRHGPVRVARDHRHLEHADGTPFFWLADTVWNGARVAAPRDWRFYATARAAQGFTVAQWAVAPGVDAKDETAVTGFADHIGINPKFFQRLDAKLETLSRAGILSAIVPLADMESQKEPGLEWPPDQASLLIRYLAARWGAEPVAWLLAFDGDARGNKVGRWKRIGEAAFADRQHAPVILYPGETPWLLNEFRDQAWVDAYGCKNVTDVTEDAVKWAISGPLTTEWSKEPARPLLWFTPDENGTAPRSEKRFSAADIRHSAYWGLLMAPPAGVSYAGLGVLNWDLSRDAKQPKSKTSDLPMWHKAMFMPGAKQMGQMGKLMKSVKFWGLRPEPKLLAVQPGEQSPQNYIAAATSEAGNLTLVYLPEARNLELPLKIIPPSPTVNWFNPRAGISTPGVAIIGAKSCQFQTPEPGDWLLLVRGAK
jgi:hypothetical protein